MFSQTWSGLPSNLYNVSEGKTYQQKKDEYKFRKIKDKAKKIFVEEMKNSALDFMTIPEVKRSNKSKKFRLVS